MSAGDQKVIGTIKHRSDNRIKGLTVNTILLKNVMELNIPQSFKKSLSIYNFNALVTNIIMNYVIYKKR